MQTDVDGAVIVGCGDGGASQLENKHTGKEVESLATKLLPAKVYLPDIQTNEKDSDAPCCESTNLLVGKTVVGQSSKQQKVKRVSSTLEQSKSEQTAPRKPGINRPDGCRPVAGCTK